MPGELPHCIQRKHEIAHRVGPERRPEENRQRHQGGTEGTELESNPAGTPSLRLASRHVIDEEGKREKGYEYPHYADIHEDRTTGAVQNRSPQTPSIQMTKERINAYDEHGHEWYVLRVVERVREYPWAKDEKSSSQEPHFIAPEDASGEEIEEDGSEREHHEGHEVPHQVYSPRLVQPKALFQRVQQHFDHRAVDAMPVGKKALVPFGHVVVDQLSICSLDGLIPRDSVVRIEHDTAYAEDEKQEAPRN